MLNCQNITEANPAACIHWIGKKSLSLFLWVSPFLCPKIFGRTGRWFSHWRLEDRLAYCSGPGRRHRSAHGQSCRDCVGGNAVPWSLSWWPGAIPWMLDPVHGLRYPLRLPCGPRWWDYQSNWCHCQIRILQNLLSLYVTVLERVRSTMIALRYHALLLIRCWILIFSLVWYIWHFQL